MSKGSRRCLGSLAVVLGVVVTTTSGRARAQASGEAARRAVRIEYEAPPGCPDERAFERQLRARSARIVIASDATSLARVRIGERGGRFEGEVVLTDPKGRESRREVDGACADVAAALSLITALALDPMATTGSAAGPSLEPGDPAFSPPAPPLEPPPATPITPKPALPIAPPEARSGSGFEAVSDRVAETHGWGWALGADADVAEGIVPSALLSARAFVEVWRRTASALSPELRGSFARGESGHVAAGSAGAGADFTLTSGRLDLCPVAWQPGRLRLSPCALAEAGLLSGAGAGVTPARSVDRPWLTVGAGVRVRVSIVGALYLEAEGRAFVPLVRDRFFFEPDATIDRAQAVGVAGAAGIGVTFW